VRCGLAALTATALLLTGCGDAARPVAYEDVTREAGPLEFTRIKRQLFRNRAELLEFLAESNPGRVIRLPEIDFSRQEIYLVATGPRSSTGYDLRIVRVEDEGDRVVVVVRERTPSLGDPVEARVTYPFRLIALPRSDKPVKLKWLGRP
jgi:protease stability complex PrcB-like protein